jgi:hypothetical protein
MNCLDFRRRWLAEPDTDDPILRSHASDCESCRAFAQSEALFERKLHDALSVEVPRGLAERIKMRQGIVEEVRRRHVRPWKFALVASLFLVVAVAALIGYQTQRLNETETLLQQAVIDHIYGELEHITTQNNIQLDQLNLLLEPFGGYAAAGIGRVNYAGDCEIQEHPGVHIILPGQSGPVTVIYISQERVRHDSRFEHTRFDGILLPAGKGSLAIIGEHGEALGELTERLKNNIKWKM